MSTKIRVDQTYLPKLHLYQAKCKEILKFLILQTMRKIKCSGAAHKTTKPVMTSLTIV